MSASSIRGGGVRPYSRFIALAATLLASAIGISLILGVGIGDMPIPALLDAIPNQMGWTSVDLNRIHETIIWDYRLSRA